MPKIYSQNDLLKELRSMAAKSSQKEVAEQLGVTRSAISEILQGRMDISARIAEAMGYRREMMFHKIAA